MGILNTWRLESPAWFTHCDGEDRTCSGEEEVQDDSETVKIEVTVNWASAWTKSEEICSLFKREQCITIIIIIIFFT